MKQHFGICRSSHVSVPKQTKRL